LLAGAMLLIALPMVFLVDDFVRDIIVAPAAYFAWVFGVILGALPQSLLFAAVVAIGLIVAVRSLRPLRFPIWRTNPPLATTRGGAVSRWRYRLDMLQTGKYSRLRFNQHLGQLITEVLAHDERLSRRAVVSRLNAGEIEVPDGIRLVVQSLSQPELAHSRRSLLRRMRDALFPRPTESPTDIAEFVSFLETHLALSSAAPDNQTPANGDEQ